MWISKAVMEQVVAEADDKFPKETGGVLIGYVADNGEYVVLSCTGPGENALHRRFRFTPDHKWQCEQLDRAYAGSRGEWVYLGDWHTHPRGSSSMSLLDKRTLAKIAEHEDARLAFPLMMIGGGAPGSWDWEMHRFVGSALWGFWSLSEPLKMKLF